MSSLQHIRLLLGAIIQLLLLGFCKTSDLKSNSINLQPEPGFVGNLKNVTVPEGRDVVLSCTVKNLEGHKVAWIHYDRSAILTVKNHVITRNPRIGVSHEGDRTWNLHIRNVQRADQGAYMCQINTAKAKTRLGYLNVVVPPRIEDSLSSGDKVRTEGSNVTLECTARGSPTPTVIWKREDGLNINIDKARNMTVPHVEGEILRLYKVSRLDMGAYMCIASNGVPPAVSKRVQLGIDFPPMMWVPAQLTSALRHSGVTLTCFVEAHPEALTFWEHDGRMIQAGTRFASIVKQGSPSYKIEMKLSIKELERDDFGIYKCIAKNPRGQTDGTITLTEEIPPTTTTEEPPPTTPFVPQTRETKSPKDRKEKHKEELKDGEKSNIVNPEGEFSDEKDGRRDKSRYKDRSNPQATTSNYESDSWFNPRSSASSSKTYPVNVLIVVFLLLPARFSFRNYA